jgi:hypothetical protein
MPVTDILDSCWMEYDRKKKDENTDPMVFSPDQPWELTYLIRIIRKQFNEYTETAVFLSIRNATRNLPAPRKKQDFVNFVVKDLLRRPPCAN